MEDKIKVIIIIGLTVLLALSVFISLQTYAAKKSLETEADLIKAENASLSKKVEESRKENKKLQEQVQTLEADLGKSSQEKEDLLRQREDIQKKFDLVSREKDRIAADKLRAAPTADVALEAVPQTQAEQNYWAAILKAKTDLELQVKNIQSSNEQLRREKSTLEMDLNNLMQERKDLEEKMQYNAKMLDGMAADLVKEKNFRFELQEKLNSVKSENKGLRRQLNSLTNERMKLEKKLVQLNDEKAALERQLNEADLFLKERLSTITDAKQQMEIIRSGKADTRKDSVELPPIVVRSQPESEMVPVVPPKLQDEPQFGRVLSLNKEHNFIIIDLGEGAGVRVGDTFQVYRGTELIATVEVIQARKNISACDIKKELQAIRVGDTIR